MMNGEWLASQPVYQHEDRHYAVCWLIDHEAEYKAQGYSLRIVKG